jgi:parallel beta-helix repeat protein
MNPRTQTLGSILTLLVVLLVATATAYAAPIRVDCGKGGSISATLASLASAGNTRGVTILVTGTCRENLLIVAFDHLTLQAAPIATIQDASNGSQPAVHIFLSYDVTQIGFTINGGSGAVLCNTDSSCTLYLSRIQGATDGMVFVGSQGRLLSCTVSNNSSRGIDVRNGSWVRTNSNTISGNGDSGVFLNSHSTLTAISDVIQDNGAFGIGVVQGSVLRAFDLTITGNSADGVRTEQASTASFEQLVGGNLITGNGGNGVSLGDLSFAQFNDTNNVSGNLGQPDVACYPQYSATRGAGTVGGTTNCMEPEHKK